MSTLVLRSADDVAPLVQLHPETLRRLARAGKIRSYRVGRGLRFDLDELREDFRADRSGGASTRVEPDLDAI